MGKSTPVRVLSVGLTSEERKALDEIARDEDVSLGSIVRDLLAHEYPKFRKAYRPRTGIGGRPRGST